MLQIVRNAQIFSLEQFSVFSGVSVCFPLLQKPPQALVVSALPCQSEIQPYGWFRKAGLSLGISLPLAAS